MPNSVLGQRDSDTADGICQGCGGVWAANRVPGRPRKWCSERCRKGSYGDPCIDCGARTGFGAEKGRVAEPRCRSCADTHKIKWTEERIIGCLRAWVERTGSLPGRKEWIGSTDLHPARQTVVERFGSWNEAVLAAGLTPRAPGRPRKVAA